MPGMTVCYITYFFERPEKAGSLSNGDSLDREAAKCHLSELFELTLIIFKIEES